ncbi:hypothetical protein [Nocardia sp. NPDC050793]|uniref:hypothetical protein n=1 Tax=Nocardia sp. NPDC050793 TaxID=3155159 RepID=UPI0033C76947
MTLNRTRQARRMASLLTERASTRVTLDYHDSVHIRGRAWHVHWTDGPTWKQMLALAAGLADQVPGIDVTQLHPARANTALSEAVSILVWLDGDESRADYYPGVWRQYAVDEISYAERAAEPWRRRGEALLSLSGGTHLDGAACIAIDEQLRAASWTGVLAWLDEIASGGRRLRAVQ